MFGLPDVVSSSISGVQFIEVVLSVIQFFTELTETLNMILSYKSYFSLFMTYHIYTKCIHIYSYILIC